MNENEQNLTENRAQIVEKAKQEGVLAACFMTFVILVTYVADFFPKLEEKHSWTALSILAVVYLYKALKKLQPLCGINLMRPFYAHCAADVIFVASYALALFYNDNFIFLSIIFLAATLAFWMILNFRLARVTQNPLFKFHAWAFAVSVVSALTALFMKVEPGSVLYYSDAALAATAQALLVGAWYGVEDIQEI